MELLLLHTRTKKKERNEIYGGKKKGTTIAENLLWYLGSLYSCQSSDFFYFSQLYIGFPVFGSRKKKVTPKFLAGEFSPNKVSAIPSPYTYIHASFYSSSFFLSLFSIFFQRRRWMHKVRSRTFFSCICFLFSSNFCVLIFP